jgi:hypothetical protein
MFSPARDRQGPVPQLTEDDGPRGPRPIVHRKGGTALKGQLRRLIMVGCGRTLRSHDLDNACRADLVASAMNKGVVSLLYGIDFGSAPQPFGPVRFRVLKDGR